MAEDTIYREDALQALVESDVRGYEYRQMEEAIMAIPSADIDLSGYSDKLWKSAYERGKSDRPQGHYIKGENGEWYCSNCKRIDDKYSVARFCWYCGARMERSRR
jgi:hypothetical protein